jgi:hypothetical protein
LVPYAGAIHSVALFVLCYAVIFSMYGGGFATVPAYLRDMFGTRYVGAIHGLLLTAWSMAGIFGPVLVNYIREYNVTHGVAPAQAYNVTMYVMAGLLIIGFICNLFVRSVHERFHMRAVEADAEVEAAPVFGERVMESARQSPGSGNGVKLVLAWGFVGIPLVWGIVQTLVNAIKAFQ